MSFKRRGSRGVAVMCYGWYANGFRFDSHFADLTFFFFNFLGLRVTFRDSVRVRLALVRIRLGIG